MKYCRHSAVSLPTGILNEPDLGVWNCPQGIVLGEVRVDDAKIKHFSAEMLQYRVVSCFIVFESEPGNMWPAVCNKPSYV